MNNIDSKIFDKEFRKKITTNPSAYILELDSNIISDDTNVVVKKNTIDITYVIIPHRHLQLKELTNISVAASGKYFGFSSLSTVCLTISTVGSIPGKVG